MLKIRWAVLGTSFISNVLCQAIQDSSTGELVAIGTHSAGKIAELKLQYPNIKIYYPEDGEDAIAGLQRLINDKEIDAVYIGFPNFLHKEWILKCLLAGKHVLCEKPLVLDSIEMKEILNACNLAPSLVCMEALMNLYHPFTEDLKETIPKEIGQIVSFSATYNCNIANVANRNFGGAIRNLGCYPVSLIRFLLAQEPTEIIPHRGQIGSDGNIRKANLTLKFPNDIEATIYTADDEPEGSLEIFSSFKIKGTMGELEVTTNPWLPGEKNQIVITKNSGEIKNITFTAQKSLYSYEVDRVGTAIIAGNDQKCDLLSIEFISKGNVAVLETWETGTRNLAEPCFHEKRHSLLPQ